MNLTTLLILQTVLAIGGSVIMAIVVTHLTNRRYRRYRPRRHRNEQRRR